MLQTKTRPFAPHEREQVERELSEATSGLKPTWGEAFGTASLWGFLSLLAGILLGTFLWTSRLPVAVAMIPLILFPLAGAALGLRESAKNFARIYPHRREAFSLLDKRLERGEIEEITVRAEAVAEVSDDSYVGYFFDIGDNRVLFLHEDILYDAEDDLHLARSFSFSRYPDSPNSSIKITPSGSRLKPVRQLSVADQAGNWSDAFTSGTVFENATLATLETDLPSLRIVPDEE